MNERIPAYEGKKPYIFVSYAHKDAETVLPILQALFEEKYRVWYDEGIPPGSEWPKNIADHLRNAASVLVFVSKHSLASPNCENEVVNADGKNRQVLQYSLEQATHAGLSDCKTVKSYEELKYTLDDSLLGDGISGYEQGISTKGHGNFWTSILVLAVLLIAALGIGVYGLQDGWFDDYLVGLQTIETVVTEAPTAEIITRQSVLTEAAALQTKQKLTLPIDFKEQKSKDILYQLLGFDNGGKEGEMTYYDLTCFDPEEIYLEEANDEVLSLLQYFPNLKRITLQSGDVTTLQPLLFCAGLENVTLCDAMFPVEIPSDAVFTVEYQP